MVRTFVIIFLFLFFPCGRVPVKILDATIQPFTGGRELSGNGSTITIVFQPRKTSDVLHIDSLIYLGHTFPVVVRDPETGDVSNHFSKKDTLMIRITDTFHPQPEKGQMATLVYTLRKKRFTKEITSFRLLEPQIRRYP